MRKPDAWVFGSVATVSQEDLDILYCELADRFGLTYKPEAVVATSDTGAMLPALCYIAPAMSEDPADPPLAADLAACVRSLGHPRMVRPAHRVVLLREGR